MKHKVKDTWNQYRRERKADKELVIAGYLDFFYDFIKAGFAIYTVILIIVGCLLWDSLNHDNIEEAGRILGTLQGQHTVLYLIVMCIGLSTFFLAINYKKEAKAHFMAGVLFFIVNSMMLAAGIIVFTPKSVTNISLCFVLILCILKTIIRVSNLPSRHVPVCYRADTYRKKTEYWWY